MEIYAEYLFIENFIVGMIILYLSAKIGGLQICKWRICLGGILCGFFSFIIFADNMGMFMSIGIKLAFSLLLSYITFGKSILKGTLLIYIVSALMGGITIMLIYIAKIKGVANNAVLYINDISYTNIIFGVSMAFGIIVVFSEIFKGKQLREMVFAEIILEIEGHSMMHKALIDSGNFLREPLSGKAVAVMSKSAAAEMKNFKDIDFNKRYCLIPYSSVGIEKGVLEGYRVDNIYINNKPMGSIVVAVYEAEFNKNGEQEYQLLLGRDFLTGGTTP